MALIDWIARWLRSGVGDLAIRMTRAYTMYTPLERGRFRIADLLHRWCVGMPSGHRMTVKALDGRRFMISPAERQYHMGLLDRGMFEPGVSRFVLSVLRHGAIVVDAGANFGWYATLFSRLVGPTGEVHAFEPVPETCDVLRQNCELNGCDNVIVNHLGLGDRDGTLQMFRAPGAPSGDISLFPSSDAQVTATVPVSTLDAYWAAQKPARCDFIKCDVEGAELLFLRGASRVIATWMPTILIEVNPVTLSRANATPRDIFAELGRHGYASFHVIDEHSGALTRLEDPVALSVTGYSNVVCRRG